MSYQEITEIDKYLGSLVKYDGGWLDPSIPNQQWELAKREVEDMKSGKIHASFAALIDSINFIGRTTGRDIMQVLEVGAGCAYNNEVIRMAPHATVYHACDYSPTFKAKAAEVYPSIQYDVCDATELPYQDGQFDVVLSGSCIEHIRDWKKAVDEALRVSGRWAIFYKIPISYDRTRLFVKDVYNSACIEWWYNYGEFALSLRRCGFEQRLIIPSVVCEDHDWCTIVCEKIK